MTKRSAAERLAAAEELVDRLRYEVYLESLNEDLNEDLVEQSDRAKSKLVTSLVARGVSKDMIVFTVLVALQDLMRRKWVRATATKAMVTRAATEFKIDESELAEALFNKADECEVGFSWSGAGGLSAHLGSTWLEAK